MPFTDGRRQITGIELKGDIVNGLRDSEDAPFWLEALEPTTICELNFTNLGPALYDDPKFLAEVSQLLQERLEFATRHIATLGRLDSTERVTLFLAQMAVRSPGPGPVRLPMSREDIADYLGLNAETVSRILSRVKKSGLVRFLSPTEYVIPDMKAVERRLPLPVGPSEHARANTRRLEREMRKAIA